MRGLRWAVVLCFGLFLAGFAPFQAGAGDKGGNAALEGLNPTWRDARCRNRISMEIKKGRDGKGWSESPWMCEEGSGTDNQEYFCFRFRVSDRDALRSLLRDKILPAGTRFVADGWAFENSSSLKGLTLNLRFVDVPVQAHFIFNKRGSFTKIGSIERLMNIERYMRFEAFEVRPTEERLEVVAAPTPMPTSRPAPPPPPVNPPTLRVLAASVDPVRVAPGEETRLEVIYEVEDLAQLAVVNVVERRSIKQDDRVLTTMEATVERGMGIHKSSQPLRLPTTLDAGYYQLVVTVEIWGEPQEATAVFEVLDRGR